MRNTRSRFGIIIVPVQQRLEWSWLLIINCVLLSIEVIGAIVSVLIIWLVTGVLCYEAVKRIIADDIEIDADIMLITACVGVFVNVL